MYRHLMQRFCDSCRASLSDKLVLFGQGIWSYGVLKPRRKLSEEALVNLRASWDENYRGIPKVCGVTARDRRS